MGLRHFALRVCQKVRDKARTSYNEVADELVAEFSGPSFSPITVAPLIATLHSAPPNSPDDGVLELSTH